MKKTTAICILHWTVALASGIAAALMLVSIARGHSQHMPGPVLAILGVAEVIAAILFLIPQTMRFGGWCLFGVMLFAIFLHTVHHEYRVEGLLVYAAAILAVLARD